MNSKKDFMSEHLTNLNEKIKKCNIQAKNLERLHAEAEKPQPLNLDEVSAAFISNLRVNDWEILGEMFGGYKIGRIYSYILNALNERIEDSTAATIRVDVPLYEQCPTVLLKNEPIFERCPIKESEIYGMTIDEVIEKVIEKTCHKSKKQAEELKEAEKEIDILYGALAVINAVLHGKNSSNINDEDLARIKANLEKVFKKSEEEK